MPVSDCICIAACMSPFACTICSTMLLLLLLNPLCFVMLHLGAAIHLLLRSMLPGNHGEHSAPMSDCTLEASSCCQGWHDSTSPDMSLASNNQSKSQSAMEVHHQQFITSNGR
jgi:hypothetical protein